MKTETPFDRIAIAQHKPHEVVLYFAQRGDAEAADLLSRIFRFNARVTASAGAKDQFLVSEVPDSLDTENKSAFAEEK